jgi:hypothetical protein
MSRKWKDREPEKTQRLSLAELAAHDDVCSDALIDNVSPPLQTHHQVYSHAYPSTRPSTSRAYGRIGQNTFQSVVSRKMRSPKYYSRKSLSTRILQGPKRPFSLFQVLRGTRRVYAPKSSKSIFSPISASTFACTAPIVLGKYLPRTDTPLSPTRPL